MVNDTELHIQGSLNDRATPLDENSADPGRSDRSREQCPPIQEPWLCRESGEKPLQCGWLAWSPLGIPAPGLGKVSSSFFLEPSTQQEGPDNYHGKGYNINRGPLSPGTEWWGMLVTSVSRRLEQEDGEYKTSLDQW